MNQPLLTTARLDLYRPVASDLAAIAAMVAPDVMRRHLGPRAPTLADEFARLMRNAGSWALYGYGSCIVRLRGDDTVVGVCGVFHSWRGFGAEVVPAFDDVAEAGWIIAQPHWGKGYATEAMHAVLGWFDATHGPARVVCMIEHGNAASFGVAARLGFAARAEHDWDGARLTLLERARP